jgi:hypothetical protein
MTGLEAADYDIPRLCCERGLGPCCMEDIEVVGESVADVAFDLHRLEDNVLEMPLSFCLSLLSTGELLQIHRALGLYGFLPQDAQPPADRDHLLDVLDGILGDDDYFDKALAECNKYVRDLLHLIIAQGGTSGDMAAIEDAFCARWGQSGLYYMPSARTLTRLGLAYAVDSASRNYYLLPEGMVAAAEGL